MNRRNFLLISCALSAVFLISCSSTERAEYRGVGRELSKRVVIAEDNTGLNEPAIDEPKISRTAGNPGISGAEAAPKPEKRSTYSTKFNVKDKGRANNITVAANSINGIVIQPGEVFSYNNSVGPTTKKHGYKVAKVFRQGKEEKGYGGGVCQVSSTLYNTADLFGMEIIERHPHSKEVKYVPEGRDAATSNGGVDLKFKNIMPFPVKIETNVKDGVLTIDMFAFTGTTSAEL